MRIRKINFLNILITAYILADAGYDVFMTNNRGNYYSRQHLLLNPDIIGEFWNFSYPQIALNDYTAVIDHILLWTGQEKLYLVGHSQGTSGIMCLLSERPEYNAKVAAVSLMSPIGYLSHLNQLFTTISQLAPLLEVIS